MAGTYLFPSLTHFHVWSKNNEKKCLLLLLFERSYHLSSGLCIFLSFVATIRETDTCGHCAVTPGLCLADFTFMPGVVGTQSKDCDVTGLFLSQSGAGVESFVTIDQNIFSFTHSFVALDSKAWNFRVLVDLNVTGGHFHQHFIPWFYTQILGTKIQKAEKKTDGLTVFLAPGICACESCTKNVGEIHPE